MGRADFAFVSRMCLVFIPFSLSSAGRKTLGAWHSTSQFRICLHVTRQQHYRHGYDPTSVKSHFRWRCLFTRGFRPPRLAHHDCFSPYHRHPSRPRIKLHTLLQAGRPAGSLLAPVVAPMQVQLTIMFTLQVIPVKLSTDLSTPGISIMGRLGRQELSSYSGKVLRMVTVARWIGAALVGPLFIASCIQKRNQAGGATAFSLTTWVRMLWFVLTSLS